jgi:prenyltransferase beta subunit
VQPDKSYVDKIKNTKLQENETNNSNTKIISDCFDLEILYILGYKDTQYIKGKIENLKSFVSNPDKISDSECLFTIYSIVSSLDLYNEKINPSLYETINNIVLSYYYNRGLFKNGKREDNNPSFENTFYALNIMKSLNYNFNSNK